jgi:hypothetical protein
MMRPGIGRVIGGFAVLMALLSFSGRLTVIVLSNRAEVDAPALAESVADLYFLKR